MNVTGERPIQTEANTVKEEPEIVRLLDSLDKYIAQQYDIIHQLGDRLSPVRDIDPKDWPESDTSARTQVGIRLEQMLNNVTHHNQLLTTIMDEVAL